MILVSFIAGCTSTPVPKKIPFVSENEVFNYEKKYLAEYAQLKKTVAKSTVEWTQPINKKTPCKVYDGLSKDVSYKIYWDGGCKDGYANGLGREFIKGATSDRDSLAIYKEKQKKPQYYIDTFHLKNMIIEGDLNNDYYVKTNIKEDNFDFNITREYGYWGGEKVEVINSSPLSDKIIYAKIYPNFSHMWFNLSNDEFQKVKYNFYTFNKNWKKNGFGFTAFKNGSINSAEHNNGVLTRLVRLPDIYFIKANKMLSEIKTAGRLALKAQKQALKVKKQYMRRICKKSVSVSFIDNEEYKKICKDNEYYAELKGKIEAKLGKISRKKQQKREQIRKQQLTNMQQLMQLMQIDAAQRQADAAEDAAYEAKRQNNKTTTCHTNYGVTTCF